MNKLSRARVCWAIGLAALAAAGFSVRAQNVLQPGDPIIASSSNSPGSEGVANAIDGQPTKYLNFDSRTPAPVKPSGFVVTPKVGATRVTGMSIQSANDAPERDPKTVTLEGSNDDTITAFSDGNWTLVTTVNVPDFATRFQTQTFTFENTKPYKSYRWTVTATYTDNGCCMQVAEVGLLGSVVPGDVTVPGDKIIASSSNSPGSEGVANAIDGQPTKYLNFDSRTPAPIKPSGFVITPGLGRTLVTGLSIQSANDAPERDPKTVTLEGSNDDTIATFAGGNWELITTLDGLDFSARFQKQTFLFDNYKPYKSYRWTVVATRTDNGCCMQVAEVEFLGTGAPKDVTQPGDPIFASSSNSPGSEGVANVIDGQPTKYLNFDSRTPAPIKPSGFAVAPKVGATVVIGMTIQSANDAPERDPKTILLEGSNDATLTSYAAGTWETITQIEDTAYTARFQTHEFYFPNQKSYKNYRWTVLATASDNGCCMQVAEVELLAVTGNDCNKARFTLQPVNTPVLSGASATFFAAVNGPWSVRWLQNGSPIAGANSASYTTDPITAANAGDKYQVEIVGCEKSQEVQAQIFTPSTTKSIGISFVGSGANGAPTTVNKDDIVGVHPQAYWNNAPGASGDLPGGTDPDGNPFPLLDSSNAESTITFNYTTSGSWGAGTGNQSGTQRMLNGLVRPSLTSEATFTFANVPAGKHAVLVYAVSPPLVFDTLTFKLNGKTEKSYFARVLTPDEYNAAPGFYRVSSTDPAKPTIGDFIRFDDVEPAADGTLLLTVINTTVGGDQHAGVNGLQLVLNATNPGDPPAITGDPQPTAVEATTTTSLSVKATGNNLTYQWLKDGRNLPNGGHVSGATTANLTLSSFSKDDEGVYSVAVFNPAGSVISKNAAVRISPFDIKNGLAVHLKLDEASGTTAANSATGGSAGTVTGTATWGTGIINKGFSFDGGSYILVPKYTHASTAISGSVWVNLPALIQSDVALARNGSGALAAGGAGRILGQFEIGLVYDATAGALFPKAVIGIGPNLALATSVTPFPVGSGFRNIAFTADGAQLRLYVDGVEAARADYLSTITTPGIDGVVVGGVLTLDATDPANPILGPDASNPNFLTGVADDVAVWTRALSASTIKAIYDAGKAGKDVETVVEPKPAPLGPTITTLPSTGGLGAVETLLNVTVDTSAKTIRANLPADLSKPSYLKIAPAVTILSVKIEGSQLVITYQ